MDLIKNTGRERVLDKLEEWLLAGSAVDLMSPSLSLHAFAEVRELLKKADSVRLLLEDRASLTSLLFGGLSDIGYRNKQ